VLVKKILELSFFSIKVIIKKWYHVFVYSIQEGKDKVAELKEKGELDKYIQPLVNAISEHAVTGGSCSGSAYGYHLHEFEDENNTPKN